MPTYKFRNKNTGEEYEEFMGISAMEKYLEENPHIEQLVNGFPMMCDPTRVGIKKPTSNFRDRLKDIKKSHWKSNINSW
jgi:hypothetical protein